MTAAEHALRLGASPCLRSNMQRCMETCQQVLGRTRGQSTSHITTAGLRGRSGRGGRALSELRKGTRSVTLPVWCGPWIDVVCVERCSSGERAGGAQAQGGGARGAVAAPQPPPLAAGVGAPGDCARGPRPPAPARRRCRRFCLPAHQRLPRAPLYHARRGGPPCHAPAVPTQAPFARAPLSPAASSSRFK